MTGIYESLASKLPSDLLGAESHQVEISLSTVARLHREKDLPESNPSLKNAQTH